MIDTGGGLDRLHISPQSNPPVPEDGKEKHSLSFIHEAPSKRFVFQITHTMEKTDKAQPKPDKTKERETEKLYSSICLPVTTYTRADSYCVIQWK